MFFGIIEIPTIIKEDFPMSENYDMNKARSVYNSLISMLNTRDWKYQPDDENMLIRSGIKGEDLPIEFVMIVNPRNEVVQFLSGLPFKMPEDMRVDGALAVAVANYGLVDGSFDYDLNDGEIRFRLTCSYRDSVLGADLFEYMIGAAASTVENYNDRFFMLAKKMITIEKFIEMES